MNDCCVDNLKEIHAIADYTFGFQRFILASPFILLIPNIDATANNNDLVQIGMEMAGSITVSEALQRVNRNQKLPDFVDTVKNLGKIASRQQMQICYLHALEHSKKGESDYNAFWMKTGDAYKNAMFGKI